MTTRRSFLTTSSLAAAALGTPWRLSAAGWDRPQLLDAPPRRRGRRGDPDLKALAQKALDAATAAGASYADVRITITQQRRVAWEIYPSSKGATPPDEIETIAVGVRALTRGAWGFMADTQLTDEMMVWLGRKAAEIGKASAWPKRPPIELGERLPAVVGHWEMPVKRDPLKVSDAEFTDLMNAMRAKIPVKPGAACRLFAKFNFARQERTFASTEGSFTTQVVYNTFNRTDSEDSSLEVLVAKLSPTRIGHYFIDAVSPCSMGLEVFEERKIIDRIPEYAEIADEACEAKRLDNPGRFDVVFDGNAMAALVSSLGTCLEADRALGYEANAGGTSYLAPIEKMLGTPQFPAGVTITADRTRPGGAATVHWDDEGVVPQDFPLVKDGAVVDYTMSREFVPKLAAKYQTRGLTAHSRGCAGAEDALSELLVQTPNLQLHPGAKDVSFDELVSGIEDGFAVMGGKLELDQQQLNAMGEGNVIYSVKKGRLADIVKDVRYMVRMPDLWKDLVTLGGARSAETRGFTVQKGQPEQASVHSVQAVAARFKNVAMREIRGQGLILGGDN